MSLQIRGKTLSYQMFFIITDNGMGVSKFEWTDVILIDLGLSINATYFLNVVLTQKLLLVSTGMREFVIFQQHKPPAHQACKTISTLEWETYHINFVRYMTPNKIWRESAAVSLPNRSERRHWTEAASDRRMGWCGSSMTYLMSGPKVTVPKGGYFQHLVTFQSTSTPMLDTLRNLYISREQYVYGVAGNVTGV